jgi:hypothetical protein
MKLTSGGNHFSDVLAGVQDQQTLRRFRAKRGEWFELFESSKREILSIQRQLQESIFQDLSYRVVSTEASRSTAGQGYAIPTILYLLNVGYVTSQCLAARRLLDERTDVASLTRVLKDVKRHRGLITRECFVAYDGTPYEHNVFSSPQDAGDRLKSDIYGIEGPGFSRQLRSLHRHERFDRLSAIGSEERNRHDLIQPEVFERLATWTRSTEALRLKKVSDERFAHAGDGRYHEKKNTPDDVLLLEPVMTLRGVYGRCGRA